MLFPLSIVIFLGDYLKELIFNGTENAYQLIGIEGFLTLVDFFNLIEYFGVASLFGWLTFAALTDSEEQLKGLSERRKKQARINRVIINDLFVISFLFFSASGVLDYILHHLTISSGLALFPRDLILVGTLDTFVAGVLLLAAPVIYQQRIGKQGRTLADINPLPTLTSLLLCCLTVLNSTMIWTAAFSSEELFYVFMVIGVLPIIGLGLSLKYWADKRRRIWVLKWGLIFAPLLVIGIMFIIGLMTGTVRTTG